MTGSSVTRRKVIAGLALTAAPAALAVSNNSFAQAQQGEPEKSLYERLGGERGRSEKPSCRSKVQKLAPAGMAYQESRKATWP